MPDTYFITDERRRHNAAAHVSGLTVEQPCWVVKIERYKRDRSLAQNRLYWWWLRHIADHINATGAAQVVDQETGEVVDHRVSEDDLHDWFRNSLLPTRVVRINGRLRRSRKSTARLTVTEFTEYLEKIEQHCAERMDLILPRPDDYSEAMGYGG